MCSTDKTNQCINVTTTSTPTPSSNNNYYAILDSGASHHFLLNDAPTKSKDTKHDRKEVKLPDGTVINSSHKCELDLHRVPKEASDGYILPDMKNHSLLSVTHLCKAGCQVNFTGETCIVTYKGKEIMRGERSKTNGLWLVPLTDKVSKKQIALTNGTANSAYHTSTLAETIQFLHQCLFSPTLDTLCKAIDNNQLIGFPNLTSRNVRKYLPASTATVKGHMNRMRKGTRSTTKTRPRPPDEEEDMRPKQDKDAEWELMIGATIADNTDGTLYTDQTGAFPVVSYKGNKIIFVAYEYRSNAIIAKPIRSNSDESLVAAFKEIYEYLSDKGFKPKLNVMDNQCSKAVQKYIQSQNTDIQLVNPDDHRVNAAERAIQTWKNHFLAGLNTIDPNCPVQLWDEFVNQGMITLNLLRASRVNPKLSAYAQLEGQYNFDRTPMAPVGTKSLIFLDPNKRRSYQNHALDAWYVGPAMSHYRNYRFWLPDTHGF